MFEHVLSREVAQERYSQKLKARSRQTSTLAGYRCLCCKDTALVSPEVVRRYQLSEGMLGVYDSYVMGDVAFLCRKVLCEANQVEVTMTDGSTKFVAKYSPSAVDGETINADMCDWLHKQEWDRIRAIDEQTMRSAAVAPTPIAPPAQKSDRIIETAIAPPSTTSSQLSQIKPLSEVLPSLSSLGHSGNFKGALEPENEIVEADGFRVGDRVKISDDHLDKDGRREWRKERPPVDQFGVITRLFLNKVALSYGMSVYRASLRLDGDGSYSADVSFLRRAIR